MVQQFRIVPQICMADTCREFCEQFQVGEKDLILTNPRYYENCMAPYVQGAQVVYLKKYGTGEPTDLMVEQLCRELQGRSFDRVIAVGGGSILDVAKLLVQETVLPLKDLFEKKIPTRKNRKLILVPTTCGTGSELTSVSVIDMTCMGSKIGLQTDEEYADAAVLIPELLEPLPFGVFGASSIDALIHAIESYLSPKATPFSELFSEKAMELILNGYRSVVRNGQEELKHHWKDFLLASAYAGIAFGNAGCAAVHAMSMPFSGAYHVPHGEANYVIFTGVFKTYNRLAPEGKIRRLNRFLAELLACEEAVVYDRLEELLDHILKKKTLREYGVREEELEAYTRIVMTRQGRLTANNYTELGADTVLEIYRSLY